MLIALCAILLLAPPDSKASPAFADLVDKNFTRWDLNKNGVITPDEIDRIVVAPEVVGDEAAAIGAIKTVLRAGYPLPPMTADYFKKAAPRAKPTKDDTTDPDNPEIRYSFGPNWQKTFLSCRKRIQNPDRSLFRSPQIDLTQFKQGALGDCYFVAMIGSLVNKQHEQIRKMISIQKNGDIRVAFADNQTIVMPPLTDTEIAISSTGGEEGTWMAVLEKAFGTLRQAQYPQIYKDGVASDTIGRGGQMFTTIRILSGHESETYNLVTSIERRGDDEVIPKMAAAPNDLQRMVREKLKQPLSRKKIVGAGVYPIASLPPGIVGRHAYAILSYEQASDSFTVWNPHGNNFTPKGPPGLKNGYATKSGIFKVPCADFVQIFHSLEIELDISAVTEGQRDGRTSGNRTNSGR